MMNFVYGAMILLTILGGAAALRKGFKSWQFWIGLIFVIGGVATLLNLIVEWSGSSIQLDFRPIYAAIWNEICVPIGNWVGSLGD